MSKKDRILKLEKYCFSEKTFCPSALGRRVRCSLDDFSNTCSSKSLQKMVSSLYDETDDNNEDFNYVKNIDTVAILKKIGNEYYLLLKHGYPIEQTKNKDTIGIDLGIRTIGTGYSNDKITEFGKNIYEMIKKRLLDIDHLNTLDKPKKQKEKIIKKRNDKLKNIVNDMHWKLINYLIKNYGKIIIGNFSTKRMKESDNVSKLVKRVGDAMSFYKMKEKLKYKCKQNGIEYKMIDEEFTTQCCGKCGNQKKDVGSAEIYKCDKCEYIAPRDVNSSRLHIIKALAKMTKKKQIELRKKDNKRYKKEIVVEEVERRVRKKIKTK